MKDRGLLIALGVGCLVLLACAAIVVVGGTLTGLFTIGAVDSAISPPTDVELGVIAPGSAKVGETFGILVRVTNTAADTQVLDSIDIQLDYLEGIRIESTDPPYSDTFEVFGYQSYTLLQDIPPGRELVVQFTASAVAAGNYRGDIDICINTGGNCTTRVLHTVVEP